MHIFLRMLLSKLFNTLIIKFILIYIATAVLYQEFAAVKIFSHYTKTFEFKALFSMQYVNI
jgi:hypothetical protein